MDIKTLAFILLIGRMVSEFFIIMVLLRQWQIRKTRTHPRLMQMRRVLVLLAVIVFLGNLYPLFLDAWTLIAPTIRSAQKINPIGVAYSLDNSWTFMVASILIWTLYKLADVVIETAELIAGRPLHIMPEDE